VNGAGVSGTPLTLSDFVGFGGVAIIVSTYLLLQVGRMSAHRPFYPGANAIGAAMVLFSLYFRPNPPSVVIESFWLAISILGFVRALTIKR